MNKWNISANMDTIEKTIQYLKNNGINALVVENSEEAKNKALELIPAGAEVTTMTSVTLEQTGIAEEINKSGLFNSGRKELSNESLLLEEKKRIGAIPDWAVGSVHAVTEDGSVLIASNSGSQLGAYAYGANHVIWVVGTQKIVKNTEEGIKRIYEYTLPLEAARANKAYNITTGSFVSKLLIINKEVKPDRITLIFIKENLGF